MDPLSLQSHTAVYENGQVVLQGQPDWPSETKLLVLPVAAANQDHPLNGHVIVVGYGLVGRAVTELLDNASIPFTLLEQNPATVKTQRALGRSIIQGDAVNAKTLAEAGLHTAAVLALTIPNEEAVLQAITIARRLRPEIYIIARTNYSSMGMKAKQLGADDVIKAEQSVAIHFYQLLAGRLQSSIRTPEKDTAP